MRIQKVGASVVMRRSRSEDRWQAAQWRPVAVVPESADVALQSDDVRHDGFEIGLFRDEAEGYFLNMTSGVPAIFVHWVADADAEPTVMHVTVSYHEAARWLDAGESVEHVPMPDEMQTWVGEFVAAYWSPEPRKRRRPQSFLEPGERGR